LLPEALIKPQDQPAITSHRQKLPYPLLRLNILPYEMQQGRLFILLTSYEKPKPRASQSTSIMQLYTAKSMKTSLGPLKWLKYLKYALARNI
jgi:hypothetical protein